MGITNLAIIEIGNDCQFAQFWINTSKLEKVRSLDQEIKNSSMEKYCKKHIMSKKYSATPEGQEIPIKNTLVEKGWESYFATENGLGKYLEPCMSFHSTDTLTNGTTHRREFHVSVDAAMYANKADEDIIEYEKHSKPQ